ncbi:futalosine hydrolase [Cohnella nanjingensis]|uniref:Futalosine hydrolase n=1 Tax=Cohnella nanjingensis TaxID=1387779 RepID=A0A7X0RZ17_9BACL|nr:futalosine hydrolase [Cohnella nanjingensis]MBB6674940.1 futalosine hydrolase [Cohnella nanjingensis]
MRDERRNGDDRVKENELTGRRVLIMTAVEAEREAVLRGLGGDARFDARLAGVGPAGAAARTAAALAAEDYALVVSAGIGGGFSGVAPVGTVAIADRVVAADLGAETGEGGFASVDELGFGSSVLEADERLASALADALRAAGRAAALGPVLTVTTATGSQGTADALARRTPGAVAEAMEGYGVAVAASERQTPFLEIRGISNAIGPRDRSAWRIGDALEALTAAITVLKEVVHP